MRAALVASLLVSGGRVAAESQHSQYGTGDRSSITNEGIFQARQAFREIHDKLLSSGDVQWNPTLGVYGCNASHHEAEEPNTGFDEVLTDDDESGSLVGQTASGPKSRSTLKTRNLMLLNLDGTNVSCCSALTGRFLHITDFHPDPWYRTGSTFESGCHRLPEKKKKKKGKKGKDKDFKGEDDDDDEPEVAGKWGTAVS
jgi:hypothetical protein